jgi:hypothetical protein
VLKMEKIPVCRTSNLNGSRPYKLLNYVHFLNFEMSYAKVAEFLISVKILLSY